MSTLIPSKNAVWRPEIIFFIKMYLKKCVFPKAFPPCSNCWSNFAHVGSKANLLMKFLDDSAWFCLEKLKNMFFQPETLIFNQKSPKYQTHPKQICENIGFQGPGWITSNSDILAGEHLNDGFWFWILFDLRTRPGPAATHRGAGIKLQCLLIHTVEEMN